MLALRPGVEFLVWLFIAAVAVVGGLLVGGLIGDVVGSDLFGGAVFSLIVIAVGIAARRRGWLYLLAFGLGLVLTAVVGFVLVVHFVGPSSVRY
jgi:hypothetical protein